MRKINVLMIGNSFSVDAARYTHLISLGSEVEIELGVLYVGGCSLEQHINFIKEGSSPYEWFINGESTGKYISLKDALAMKEWDYITLQQVSYLSGRKETFYPYIKELMEYVKGYQKKATFALHKTWPYQSDFKDNSFSYYHFDRKYMYQCIDETYQYVSKDLGINIIIRSGDIIERAIEQYGEMFHSDGLHLNDKGRYLASLGFVHSFNNNQMLNDLYVPSVLDKETCLKYEQLVKETLN